MNIVTNRLIIRPLFLADLNDFHDYRADPEVAKYQGFDPMNLEESKAFIIKNSLNKIEETGTWVQYGIQHKSSKTLVGDCALRNTPNDHRIMEMGLTFSNKFQGKGLAYETMIGVLGHIFDTQDKHRIEITTDEENTSAIKLLEKLKFRKEGHYIENIFFNGKWGNEYFFAMLNKEWQKNKEQLTKLLSHIK